MSGPKSKKPKRRKGTAARPLPSGKAAPARKPREVPLGAAARRRVKLASLVVEQVNASRGAGGPVRLDAARIAIPGPDGRPQSIPREEVESLLSGWAADGRITFPEPTAEGFVFTVVRRQGSEGVPRRAVPAAAPKASELPAIGDVMRETLAAVEQGAQRHAAIRKAVARALGAGRAPRARRPDGDSMDRRVQACVAVHKGMGHMRQDGALHAILPAGRARLAAGAPFEGREIPRDYRQESPLGRTARHSADGTYRAAARLAEAIPGMPPDRLVRVWANANRILAAADRADEHAAALHVMEAVEAAWDALEIREEDLFAWPSTEVPPGTGASAVSGFRSEGMLSYLEYRAGKTAGLSAQERQSILARVFEGKLPRVFEHAYMNQWGEPGSGQRLKKIAESLAAFARNFKRLDADRYDEAVRHWEQDLDMLYHRYYVGRFGFGWPSTAVEGDTAARSPGRR